jgi:hypothetical protein
VEDQDCRGVEEGLSRGEGGLRVLPEAAVAADPGEEALADPSAWVNGEADLPRRLSHDREGDACGRGGSGSRIAAWANALVMNGKVRRDDRSNGTAPSRSCTSAEPLRVFPEAPTLERMEP